MGLLQHLVIKIFPNSLQYLKVIKSMLTRSMKDLKANVSLKLFVLSSFWALKRFVAAKILTCISKQLVLSSYKNVFRWLFHNSKNIIKQLVKRSSFLEWKSNLLHVNICGCIWGLWTSKIWPSTWESNTALEVDTTNGVIFVSQAILECDLRATARWF